MNDRGLIYMLGIFYVGLLFAMTLHVTKSKARMDALEIRLQNTEHLLSLALSESRSPALTNRFDGVPASTNAN